MSFLQKEPFSFFGQKWHLISKNEWIINFEIFFKLGPQMDLIMLENPSLHFQINLLTWLLKLIFLQLKKNKLFHTWLLAMTSF